MWLDLGATRGVGSEAGQHATECMHATQPVPAQRMKLRGDGAKMAQYTPNHALGRLGTVHGRSLAPALAAPPKPPRWTRGAGPSPGPTKAAAVPPGHYYRPKAKHAPWQTASSCCSPACWPRCSAAAVRVLQVAAAKHRSRFISSSSALRFDFAQNTRKLLGSGSDTLCPLTRDRF